MTTPATRETRVRLALIMGMSPRFSKANQARPSPLRASSTATFPKKGHTVEDGFAPPRQALDIL